MTSSGLAASAETLSIEQTHGAKLVTKPVISSSHERLFALTFPNRLRNLRLGGLPLGAPEVETVQLDMVHRQHVAQSVEQQRSSVALTARDDEEDRSAATTFVAEDRLEKSACPVNHVRNGTGNEGPFSVDSSRRVPADDIGALEDTRGAADDRR